MPLPSQQIILCETDVISFISDIVVHEANIFNQTMLHAVLLAY